MQGALVAVSWRLRLEGVPALVPVHAEPGREPLALNEKDAALLAYVALEGPVPSRRVAALVWPGRAEVTALNNLRQRLSKLRRLTGARLLVMTALLELAPDLRPEPGAEPPADPTHDDPPPLLAPWSYDDCAELAQWLQSQRQARLERTCAHWETLASAAEAAGRIAHALVCTEHLLRAAPLAEPHVRRLMRLHYLGGNVAAATAVFERLEQTLRDELGLRPSAETRELLQLIETARLPAPPAVRSLPVSLLRPPVTVGREGPAGRLRQVVHDGLVGLVLGEAGMGKTRLVSDLVATVPGALLAQARPGDRGVPFALVDRLLAAALERWPGALPSLSSEALLPALLPRLAAALAGPAPASTSALAAPAGPVLSQRIERAFVALRDAGCAGVVADDLHFADAASLELLHALIGSEALAGLAWTLAHRPPPPDEPESRWLLALAELPRSRVIALEPLDEAALGMLLESLQLPGAAGSRRWAEELNRRSGGNPLFALETLREALARGGLDGPLPVPRALEHLIRDRLDRLSAPALALARVAAVAGAELTVELAAEVLEQPVMALAGAWHELEQAEVLRGTAFAHDLVQEVMARITPGVVAQAVHRRAAGFLVRAGAAAARVAPHWSAGGEHRQALKAWREAARQAVAAGRVSEATVFVDSAAQAAEAVAEAEEAFTLRCEAVRLCLSGQGVAEAHRRCEVLRTAARHDRQRAQAAVVSAATALMRGAADEALQFAEQAQALASASDDALRLRAALAKAHALIIGPQAQRAWPTLEPWVDRIDSAPDPADRFEMLSVAFGAASGAHAVDRLLTLGERHLALAQAMGRDDEAVVAHMNLSLAHTRLGQPGAAIEHAREADRLLSRDGLSPGLAVWNRIQLGIFLAGRGSYSEASTLLQAGREALAPEDPPSALLAVAEDFLGALHLLLGQTARAHLLAREEPVGVGPVQRARRLVLRAQVAAAMGQDPRSSLQAAQQLCGEQGPLDTRLAIGIEQSRLLQGDEAVAALAGLEHEAHAGGFPVLAELAACLRLERLCELPGAEDEALDTLVARVDEGARRCQGLRVYFPQQMLACCRAHQARGRMAEARRCLDDGLAWVDRVAREELTEAQRDAFLTRNRVNAALRTLRSLLEPA